MQNQPPLKIFIAFANEDRDVRDKLLAQMNLLKTREHWDIWASHEIKAGSVWNEEIKARLTDSEVVVLLMSSHFFNSNYILDIELPAIIEKHKNGNCHIIPVLAKKCLWKDTPFGDYIDLGKIQALPSGERPIVSKGAWDSDEDPYVETVIGIKDSVRAFRIKKAEQDRLKLLEIQENQEDQQEPLRKQKAIDEKNSTLQVEKMQRESGERFLKVEDQDIVMISTRSLPPRKYYYLVGAGLVILMALILRSIYQDISKLDAKTDDQHKKVPINSSIANTDSQSVKSPFVNKIIQKSNQPSNPPVIKPQATTKNVISSVKGPGTGRYAVRSGTFTYMEGARRRLEEVIRAGYPNAEIAKTVEGMAAVIVFRSNDKDAVIHVVDVLEGKGLDSAVFDRGN